MNTRTVNMMESFTTHACHGTLTLNFAIFPELEGKSDEEIQIWLNNNYSSLFVNSDNGELRKDKNYIYSAEQLEECKANGEDPEPFEDESVVSLNDYWSESEVQWDKIKNETQSLVVVQGDETH